MGALSAPTPLTNIKLFNKKAAQTQKSRLIQKFRLLNRRFMKEECFISTDKRLQAVRRNTQNL